MIERYSRKEIKSNWEDYKRNSIWLKIELAAAEAMEKLRIIPRGVVKKVKLKETIKDHLINKHVSIFDLGPFLSKSVDYPDYAKKLAKRIKAKKSDIGILVCGSGTGMAISANKIKDIRAAVCYNPKSTRLSRQHNNANIIALGARLTKKSLSLK